MSSLSWMAAGAAFYLVLTGVLIAVLISRRRRPPQD